MAASTTGKVKLISSDNETIEMDLEVARMSQLLASMIDTCGTDEEIPISSIKGKILRKVKEYCEMHKGSAPPDIDKPLKSANLAECNVSEQDMKFLEMDMEDLFSLVLAANFLNIKPLLDLTCARIASKIKGKSVEEIRKTFNIVNDFTPEQEAQVREENKWCEDS